MPIADWTVPFDLTSAQWSATMLGFNQPLAFSTGTGVYRLRNDACQLTNTVRETKDFIPQAPGALLHRRFVGGMEMALTVQLWELGDKIACDELLQEMIDELMGYLYQLLNAGDNEGRLTWQPLGANARMLDDIRLLTYPVGTQSPGAPYEITFSIDTQYPYAEDLTQQLVPIAAGATVVVNNTGTEPTFPVFQVNKVSGVLGAGGASFSINNLTTGVSLDWNSALPGVTPGVISAAQYLEIDTFRNTIFLNGTGANETPGIVMPDSDFPLLVPGSNSIQMVTVGADMLWNPAWA